MYTPNHKSIRIAISAFVIIISQAFGGLTAAQAAGFSSTFNNAASAVGWSAVNGAWGLTGSNYYYSRGVPGYYASAKHTGAYVDLTYTVRMMRRGSDTGSAQYIIIRGNPLSLNTTKNWKTSYVFGYSNSGYFSVWRGNPNGTVTSLKSWTTSAAIAKKGWNILKVVAVGTSLKFYINNALVYSGADGAWETGQVGFNFYRDTKSTGNILYVDYAILSTTPASLLGDRSPCSGAKVFTQVWGVEKPVIYKWNAVPDATYYEFLLWEPGAIAPMWDQFVQKPYYFGCNAKQCIFSHYLNAVYEGVLNWRVRAFRPFGWTSWTSTCLFQSIPLG